MLVLLALVLGKNKKRRKEERKHPNRRHEEKIEATFNDEQLCCDKKNDGGRLSTLQSTTVTLRIVNNSIAESIATARSDTDTMLGAIMAKTSCGVVHINYFLVLDIC